MKRNLLLIGFGLLILFMAVFLRHFVKEWVVIPLIRLIWIVEGMPQDLLWFLFIGVIIFFAYKTINKWKLSWNDNRYARNFSQGHLDDLIHLVRQSHRSDYFLEKMTRHLSELTIETLSCRERLTPAEVKKNLYTGSLPLPKDISDFLRSVLEVGDNPLPYRGRKSTDRSLWLKIDPLRVIEFLEDQLNAVSKPPADQNSTLDRGDQIFK